MKHILAEKPFLSGQGEGIHCGKPSIFIRYAGCNLRCQFGLKCPNSKGRDIPENIQKVIDNLDSYKELNDLPVFPNYCDTYVGILPEFKRFWTTYDLDELVESIMDLIKDKPNYKDLSNVDVVFTGGEPMLFQNQTTELIDVLVREHGLKNITFETNGTVGIKPELSGIWKHLDNKVNFTFSISPKISSANYTKEDTCKPEAVKSLQDTLKNGSFVLKYVVQGKEDLPVLNNYTDEYKKLGFKPNEVCLMPCGGKADPEFENMQRKVFDLCVENGYRYSPRLQMIWKNAWSR